MPEEFSKELVSSWCAKYLGFWASRVGAGDVSPNSQRDVLRWARGDGHWGYRWNRDIRSITNGDITEWHGWLAERRKYPDDPKKFDCIGAKTRKNASDGFRTMLLWARESAATGRGRAWPVPVFPTISYAKPKTQTVSVERVTAILEHIAWEDRRIYLAIGFESVRFGTASATLLEDFDPKTNEIHWHRGRQGQRLDSPVGTQKNHEATRREPWAPQLIKWLEWRHEQASDADRLAGRAQSLFWHLDAHNVAKTWNYTSYLRKWNAACTKAGESIAPQAGTRHSILSRPAEVLTPHELQDRSQHRSLQSLSHYTTGARANHAAVVKAIRPRREK